eukprot:CAMPEP_0172328238 /NCGR_PEP_ID=MMETSP1058-20130122/60245_1 /TAXON_ID=83371 /ORGANISM="Detonula confervacea, Strain CCMP 353" /LENGTH=349 /DNA_ID=CAMNT_0013045341 /DNA_START=229 /DNA_END=1276 /DNA_ORIENTATION=+
MSDSSLTPLLPVPQMEVQKIMLMRFDILKLYPIDILKHNFKCQFFLKFRLPGCAHLPRESGTDIPEPTAEWYINKIEPQNLSGEGEHWKRVDSSVWTDDDDLIITMRVEGTFFLDLDLKDFPFDTQDIKIRMIYLCTTLCPKNELRAAFELDSDYHSKLNMAGFMNPKLSWEPLGVDDGTVKLDLSSKLNMAGFMNPKLSWEPLGVDDGTVKLDCQVGDYNAGGRLFPELTAAFCVRRCQTSHYNLNVAVPAGLIAGLSLMTFCFPHGSEVRLTTSLLLIIASAAYLQVVSVKVPHINYMTKLDQYVFSNFAMLSVVTLVNGVMYICVDKGINVNIVNWVLLGVLAFGW